MRQARNFGLYLHTSASLKPMFGGMAGFRRYGARTALDEGELSKLCSGGPAHASTKEIHHDLFCGAPHTIPFKQRLYLLLKKDTQMKSARSECVCARVRMHIG